MGLKEILTATNHQKVLTFLANNIDKSFTEKQLSEFTNVSKSGVNTVLKELEKSSIVVSEKLGRMSLWTINNNCPILPELKKTLNIATLLPLIGKLEGISKRIILFGSEAQGKDTPESDIDLFIISEAKNKVSKQIRGFETERQIKPVIQSTLEYATTRNKDKGFYAEVAKGIILYERDGNE